MVHNFPHISEDDCKQVLAKYYKNKPHKLISFSLVPIVGGEINGFNSTQWVLTIKLENAQEGELKFFVKTPPTDETTIEFMQTGNLFNKEIFCYKFFEDVHKEFPAFNADFAPKYYFSRPNEMIILEDLTTSGYIMCKNSKEMDLNHIKLTLKATAQFHAASIIFEEIKSKKIGRRYSLLEDYGECLAEGLYRTDESFLGFKFIRCGVKGLCALAEENHGLVASEFKAKLWGLFDQVFEDIAPSKKFRNVLCKGDLWAKNVMFKCQNHCKIFDFQLQRYNPPAHDVLFMIYQTADRKTLQKHFHYLLDYYYDSLKDEVLKAAFDIDKILDRDEFDLSVQAMFPVIKLTKVVYKSLSALSKESLQEMNSSPKLYADLTFGDRSDFMVKEFRNQTPYKEIMTKLLEDLNDLLLHKHITIEDCYKIVREKLGTTKYEILEYNTTPIAEKGGFLGEHLRLKIKVLHQNVVKSLNFFVKGLPKEDEGLMNYVTSLNLFFKEMKFYTKIIPALANDVDLITKPFAKCYLARLNDILVFDDYSLKGYKTINARTPYDYQTVALVVKQLAKLHASSLIFEEKHSQFGQNYRLWDHYKDELCETHFGDNEASINFMKAITVGIQTHIDLFPDPNSTIDDNLFNNRAVKVFCKMLKQAEPSQRYRNIICHGDLWSNNIMIKFINESPIDCVFVDLQICRYNTPAHDLMCMLYLVTDSKFRAKYMLEILNLYYSELSKHFENHTIEISKILPYEDFFESCEDMKGFAIAQALAWFQNIILTTEQIDDLYSDQEVSKKYFFEDRGPFTIKICGEDPVYKEKLRECIKDLRVYCENSKDLD